MWLSVFVNIRIKHELDVKECSTWLKQEVTFILFYCLYKMFFWICLATNLCWHFVVFFFLLALVHSARPNEKKSGTRLVCIPGGDVEDGEDSPTSAHLPRIAGGLKVAQTQAMAVAVAGFLPQPKRSPLLHRASFHGRGRYTTLHLAPGVSQHYSTGFTNYTIIEFALNYVVLS